MLSTAGVLPDFLAQRPACRNLYLCTSQVALWWESAWWCSWVTSEVYEGQLGAGSLVPEWFALKTRIIQITGLSGKRFHVGVNVEIIAWNQPIKYPVGCPR